MLSTWTSRSNCSAAWGIDNGVLLTSHTKRGSTMGGRISTISLPCIDST